ncbi:MAG: SPOR domain-containing protein [Alphaproteobacteria bacterium]|nr:SPOR domain-containing protein [Alphaproteobacteria bacterium]
MRFSARAVVAFRVPVILSGLLASGCALPPAVVVASYAAEGVSYVSTGKSVTDHGVSVVMNGDCSLWRGLVEGRVCEDRPDAAFVSRKPLGDVGVADSARGGLSSVAGPTPDSLAFDFDVRRLSSPVQPVARAALPDSEAGSPERMEAEAPPVERGAGLYLVLASLPDLSSARELVASQADLSPAIMEVDVNGRHYFRVIAGPYTIAETKEARARLAASGLSGVWTLRIRDSDRIATVPDPRPSGV